MIIEDRLSLEAIRRKKRLAKLEAQVELLRREIARKKAQITDLIETFVILQLFVIVIIEETLHMQIPPKYRLHLIIELSEYLEVQTIKEIIPLVNVVNEYIREVQTIERGI